MDEQNKILYFGGPATHRQTHQKFCGIWGNEEKKYKRKVKENKKLAGLLGSPPSIYSKKKDYLSTPKRLNIKIIK